MPNDFASTCAPNKAGLGSITWAGLAGLAQSLFEVERQTPIRLHTANLVGLDPNQPAHLDAA